MTNKVKVAYSLGISNNLNGETKTFDVGLNFLLQLKHMLFLIFFFKFLIHHLFDVRNQLNTMSLTSDLSLSSILWQRRRVLLRVLFALEARFLLFRLLLRCFSGFLMCRLCAGGLLRLIVSLPPKNVRESSSHTYEHTPFSSPWTSFVVSSSWFPVTPPTNRKS